MGEHTFDSPVGAAASVIIASKTESGIVRLVRTTCKAMCRHGNEQSGVYQPFTTFLKSQGLAKNRSGATGLIFFFFYDGAVCHHSSLIEKFLANSKQAAKSCSADVQVPEFLAGCKALGLINEIVTGPLCMACHRIKGCIKFGHEYSLLSSSRLL